ncbi:MAG: class I SAM-dependent methyltransferase, partial [Lachnospiraceae bacterium]|nr:class I SAM-dependent methyltransferase [Lachnospiraceae bacterium]
RFGRIERDKDLITEKYDLIIMTEVFEHFALNPVPIMRMIKDSLSCDGRMLLTTPNWGHLPTFATWRDLPDDNETDETRYGELLECGHVYQYDYNEMAEIIKEAGFEIEYYELSESNNHNLFLKTNNK